MEPAALGLELALDACQLPAAARVAICPGARGRGEILVEQACVFRGAGGAGERGVACVPFSRPIDISGGSQESGFLCPARAPSAAAINVLPNIIGCFQRAGIMVRGAWLKSKASCIACCSSF